MLGAAIGLVLSSQAPAQQAAAPAPVAGLDEIVVTAERRESNLQSTPIAVTAIDAKVISDLSPRNLKDIALLVPNFSANKINGFNAASFAMRGVGNTDIIVYNEAPIGVIVDDFVMPSVQTQLLDPFDVDNIDVLRGPQGTLFGKNTTGGAVVVHTKAPKLGETTVEVEGEGGSYNALNARGALNIPIGDTIAMRLVAAEEREDGWMRNGASNTINGTTYTGDGRRVGGTDVFTARAKLLWEPNDRFKANFSYELLNDRSKTPAAVNVTPTNALPGASSPYFVFAAFGLGGYFGSDPLNHAGIDNRAGYLVDMPDGHRVDADGLHLNMDYRFDAGTVTWVQGYRSQDSSLPSDYTGLVGPLSVFDANRSDRRKTWQEEVRFVSKKYDQFDYVAGAFYQHDNTKFCVAQILGIYDLFGVPTPPGAQSGGYNNNPQVLCNAQTEKSAALYGEGNWHFTESTTLTLGARITEDSKDWIGRQQVFVQQLLSPTGAFNPSFTWPNLGGLMNGANFAQYPFGVVTDSHKWTQPSYRVTLSHQFDPTLYGYGTYSHGFRAGGYNDQVGTSGNPITNDEKKPTNPEKADSFELGAKAELLDRRLRLNEAVFYVRYKDAIRQVVTPVTNLNGQAGEETLFRNAAQLTVYGIENELTAKLAEGLLLRLPVSYQHCKYDNFSSGTGAAYIDLSGLDVNRCPQWTATADVSYTTRIPNDAGTVVLDVNANYVAKNLDTYSIAHPYQPWTQTYADARTLVGASVTYRGADDRWFARVLARNLTDKIYKESSQNVDPLWIWAFYGEPRYVGAELGYKFGLK